MAGLLILRAWSPGRYLLGWNLICCGCRHLRQCYADHYPDHREVVDGAMPLEWMRCPPAVAVGICGLLIIHITRRCLCSCTPDGTRRVPGRAL